MTESLDVDQPEHPKIRSYTVTNWETCCEECGEAIDWGYTFAEQAIEAWDKLHAEEGRALCDKHWEGPA